MPIKYEEISYIHRQVLAYTRSNKPKKSMLNQRISVTILEEKPVGYLIEMDETHKTAVIPKRVFIRRIETGLYDVSNIKFLRKTI